MILLKFIQIINNRMGQELLLGTRDKSEHNNQNPHPDDSKSGWQR